MDVGCCSEGNGRGHIACRRVPFPLFTRKTLGYGDPTLGRLWRVVGGIASANGSLTLDLSAPFQIDVFTQNLSWAALRRTNHRLDALIAARAS